MTDHVCGADFGCIHHREGVLCHLIDRDLCTHGLALPHAAIVKGDAAEMGFERAGLRQPSVAMKACSLDKNDWFATAFDFADQ
jgi:hypothetical protein